MRGQRQKVDAFLSGFLALLVFCLFIASASPSLHYKLCRTASLHPSSVEKFDHSLHDAGRIHKHSCSSHHSGSEDSHSHDEPLPDHSCAIQMFLNGQVISVPVVIDCSYSAEAIATRFQHNPCHFPTLADIQLPPGCGPPAAPIKTV